MPKFNLASPLLYFGNREKHIEDFLMLLQKYQQRRGKPFHYCYDLFAGSASMILPLLAEENFAEYYVINDIFKPLQHFWEQVRDNPLALSEAYNNLTHIFFSNQTEKIIFYKNIQEEFNKNTLSPLESAATFAFIINHSVNSMPYLNGEKNIEQTLCCELNLTSQPLLCDVTFATHVQQVHAVLRQKNVIFSSEKFTYYQSQIQHNDLVLLDPPGPHLTDAAESTHQHLYYRSESKAELQQQLQECLEKLTAQNATFLLLYGVLGMKNHYPIIWPTGHLLHLAGEPGDIFQEYVEHLYLSSDLVTIQYESCSQSKIQPLFHRIFETHAYQGANKNGDRTAIVWGEWRYTYAEINHAANRLAHYLLENGLAERIAINKKNDKDTLIALYLPRGPQLIISILAVMKTGAAFLPLDTNPKSLSIKAAYQRIASSHADFMLTHSELLAALQDPENTPAVDWETLRTPTITRDDYLFKKLISFMADEKNKEKNLYYDIHPENLAYVLYTSGSTGDPKGVEILHRGLPYAFESHQDLLNLNFEDKVIQFASIGFDASIMEIMMALGSGAELHLIPDTNSLIQQLQKNKITITIQTPGNLEPLDPNLFPDLRALLIVGDSFKKSLSDSWLQRIIINGREETRQVVNGYGLTETTICTTLELCSKDKNLTIGKPILGCEVVLRPLAEEEAELQPHNSSIFAPASWLVARNQEAVEKTEKGAVYVSGPCIARGYWQRDDLTKKRFKITKNNKIYYQTGDVGFYASENGEIILNGRIDRQIKIRGQRAELDEIEQTLLVVAKELIQEVRVLAYDKVVELDIPYLKQATEKVLAAYLVPVDKNLIITDRKNVSAASISALQTIKTLLLNKISGFMCPPLTNMIFVETLPLKHNDKKSIDDTAIKEKWPIPCIVLPQLQTTSLLPNATLKEQEQFKVIHQLMAKVIILNPEDLGIDQTFDQIGCTSLSTAWFIGSLKNMQFADDNFSQAIRALTLEDLDKNPTLLGVWQTLNSSMIEQQNLRQNVTAYLEDKKRSYEEKQFVKKTGFKYMREDGGLTPYSKVKLPVYLFHSLLGDAKLDYDGSLMNALPCFYTSISIPQNENWQTLEELALIHIKQLEAIHKKNEPYWFIGWSSGGLVAGLVAEKLRAQGNRVFVALLDTQHPQALHKLSIPQYATTLLKVIKQVNKIVCRWPCSIDNIALPTPEELLIHSDKIKLTEYLFNIWSSALKQIIPIPSAENTATATQALLRDWHIVHCSQKLLLAELLSEKSTQLLVDDFLIQASEEAHGDLGWEATHSSSVISISTTHFKLLHQPVLVEQLTGWLSKNLFDLKLPYYQGVAHIVNGNYSVEAITNFDLAITKNPLNDMAYYYLGNIYLEIHKYPEALPNYLQALKLNPENVWAYVNRGIVYTKLEQAQEAMQDYDEAIKHDRGDAKAFYNRALAHSAMGNPQKALEDYNEAINITSNYAMAYYNRACIYIDLNQLQKALDDLNAALKYNPKYMPAYFNRALVYHDLAQPQKSLDDFNEVIKRNQQEPDLLKAKAYYFRGIAHSRLGHTDAALANYNLTLEFNPQQEKAMINRGIIYATAGDIKAALQDFDDAIKINLKNAEARYNRALLYADYLGDLTKALEDLNFIISFISNAEIYTSRGLVHAKLNHVKEAIDDFSHAIHIMPNNAKAYQNRATAYAAIGKLEVALQDYSSAIFFEPHFALAYFNRGITYVEKGHLPEALEDFKLTIKYNPQHELAIRYYDLVKTQLDRLQEPLQDYKTKTPLNDNSENSLTLFNQTYTNSDIPNNRYDSGKWDIAPYPYEETGVAVFIYRVFKKEVEVGTAHFYHQPLLCYSEDGTRNNLLKTTGILSELNVDLNTDFIKEICIALPPTLLERLLTTTLHSAKNGFISGIANTVEYALIKKQTSALTASLSKYAFYFSSLFLSNLTYVYYQGSEEQREQVSLIAYQAIMETAKQTALWESSKFLNNISHWIHNRGWSKTSDALTIVAKQIDYNRYANFFQQGVLATVTSIVSGVTTEQITEKIAKQAVDTFLSQHTQTLKPKTIKFKLKPNVTEEEAETIKPSFS